MSKKITVSFSIPVEVKEMMERGAERVYSTNTKFIVDLIRKNDEFWFEKKEQIQTWINSKENKEGIKKMKEQDKKWNEKCQYLKEENNNDN